MEVLSEDLSAIMDKYPEDISPIGNCFAAKYTKTKKYALLAAYQFTVPKHKNSYKHTLSKQGRALLKKTLAEVKFRDASTIKSRIYENEMSCPSDPNINCDDKVKAKVTGTLIPERTGVKVLPNGEKELKTWQNLIFSGTIIECKDNTVIGKPLKTSYVVLYELDDKGKGWILTSKGSIYIVDGC